MSHNDITGDRITTGVVSDAYRERYEGIFGKKSNPTENKVEQTVDSGKERCDNSITE